MNRQRRRKSLRCRFWLHRWDCEPTTCTGSHRCLDCRTAGI